MELMRGKGPDLGPCARRFDQPDRTLLHLLRAQAETLGDAEWLVFDGRERVTFRGAYEDTNRVARALIRDLGDAPGHVGLFLRNQREFYPALLGPMAAGGVAVPLNADSRGPLLEYVVVKSRIRAIVARADLLDRLAALDSLGAVELVVVVGEGEVPERLHGARVVGYDAWLAGTEPTAPRALPGSHEVALLQFTSGTTGRSKGVVYPHHFLYLYSATITDRAGHTREDVLFSPMPLFHVAALHLIANAALHAGCPAHLRSRFSATAFWQQVAEAGATHTVILGPMAQIILKVCPEAPEHRVRFIYCVPFPPGGEEFQERFRVKLVWQGFGMTEVYTHPYFDHSHDGVARNRLGHPMAWIEYGVVDEHDRMVAPGEVGQLVFRPRLTDAMAREYFEDPEATAAAFRNFMFHTGDLGSYDSDGALYFVGRRQDRIRRRGENISAAELEAIAAGHPDVVESAAYGVPGEFGEDDVKLDVVLSDDAGSLEDLHAWLAERLPRYMVPRYLEACAAFPKTPSERIEKYKLLARGVERPDVREFERRES
jgi:crotonobetaine/carnitine-CoA ligase